MKRYLKEIEISGYILLLIGSIMYRIFDMKAGVWTCAIGILFWLFIVIYKALHWQEYQRENKQDIIILLLAIVLLWIIILIKKYHLFINL